MTLSASSALQKAIYTHLINDIAVMDCVTGIFDDVSQPRAKPFVRIGEDQQSDWSSKTFQGREHRLVLEVWTEARGRSQAKTILGLIEKALTQMPAQLDGHQLVHLRFLSARVNAAPDGLTHQGVLELRARTYSLQT
jgi:Protein of unknown function (DUF3168)